MKSEHKEMMKARRRNIKLTLSYDGTNYHGFQRQTKVVAVLLSELSDDAFRDFVGRMVTRPTDVKTSDILAAVFPGGFTAFESSVQKFIMNQ